MRPMHRLQAIVATLVALAALQFATGQAGATTFLDASFGTPQGGNSPRSLGMGSTGVSLRQGSGALFFNPAVMIAEQSGVDIDFAAGLTQANEDRLVPLYDTFQSFVTETIVALNRNTYALASGGLTWRLPGEMPVAVGAGVYERFDFDYDYFEEFRDPNSQSSPRDRLLEERQIEQSGRLRSLSVGAAGEALRHLQLGLTVHRYFGDLSRDVRVAHFQSGAREIQEIDQSLGGWGWSAGAWGRVNERVDLGVSYEGPFKVDGTREIRNTTGIASVDSTVSSSGDATVDYPGTLRMGLTYHPRNRLRTTFAIEMERRFWEGLDSPALGAFGDTVDVRDTWDLRIGVEHVFYNDLPLRLGFRYLENYADPESERSIYSAGLGYRAAGFDLDLTGLFIRQTSRQPFLFESPILAPLVPGGTTKVEDSIIQAVFGIARHF